MTMGTPGRVPPALADTAGARPAIETWNPDGDILEPVMGTEPTYVPAIVAAPPMMPPPRQPRPDYPPRGVTAYFDTAQADRGPSQLGYTARAVQVHNLSNQWLFFPAYRGWVPPNIWGVILMLIPGTDSAEWHVQTPVGHAAGSLGGVTGQVVTVWYEQPMAQATGAYVTV